MSGVGGHLLPAAGGEVPTITEEPIWTCFLDQKTRLSQQPRFWEPKVSALIPLLPPARSWPRGCLPGSRAIHAAGFEPRAELAGLRPGPPFPPSSDSPLWHRVDAENSSPNVTVKVSWALRNSHLQPRTPLRHHKEADVSTLGARSAHSQMPAAQPGRGWQRAQGCARHRWAGQGGKHRGTPPRDTHDTHTLTRAVTGRATFPTRFPGRHGFPACHRERFPRAALVARMLPGKFQPGHCSPISSCDL